MPAQETYIIDLNKLNGLHIVNNATNPVTTTAREKRLTNDT